MLSFSNLTRTPNKASCSTLSVNRSPHAPIATLAVTRPSGLCWLDRTMPQIRKTIERTLWWTECVAVRWPSPRRGSLGLNTVSRLRASSRCCSPATWQLFKIPEFWEDLAARPIRFACVDKFEGAWAKLSPEGFKGNQLFVAGYTVALGW